MENVYHRGVRYQCRTFTGLKTPWLCELPGWRHSFVLWPTWIVSRLNAISIGSGPSTSAAPMMTSLFKPNRHPEPPAGPRRGCRSLRPSARTAATGTFIRRSPMPCKVLPCLRSDSVQGLSKGRIALSTTCCKQPIQVEPIQVSLPPKLVGVVQGQRIRAWNTQHDLILKAMCSTFVLIQFIKRDVAFCVQCARKISIICK